MLVNKFPIPPSLKALVQYWVNTIGTLSLYFLPFSAPYGKATVAKDERSWYSDTVYRCPFRLNVVEKKVLIYLYKKL